MIIGFIGFGKVSKNLIDIIQSDNIKFITSFENRTPQKIENLEILPSFRDVALKSDILISANSPKSALKVASEYGKYCRGLYLDLNNISPETTVEISMCVKNFIDGAIIGKIDSKNPMIYLAGKNAQKLEFLNQYIDIKIISENIGDAAVLKLLRSTYTKTLSALLIESFNLSKKYDLENEFFEVLALTEGDDFKDKSKSRIINTINNSKRKSEELDEIINYFGDDLIMVKAALDKLKQF